MDGTGGIPLPGSESGGTEKIDYNFLVIKIKALHSEDFFANSLTK